MNKSYGIGNSSNDNKKALAYLRSCLAVLTIGILLLSTPILTGFVSSFKSSLVIDGYNEKKVLHQMVQNVYGQEESKNIDGSFGFPNYNIFGSDRLPSSSPSTYSPTSLSLKSSLSSNSITDETSSFSTSNVSNFTESSSSLSNITNITSSPSNSLQQFSTTMPSSSTESIQSESLSSSSAPSSHDMISSSYFADKENVQYNYDYPLKNKDGNSNEQIKECTDCFISELKKLDDKALAEQILTDIKNKFGGLSQLCKLIAYGDINRDQLENILYSILFASGNSNNDAYESNTKEYVENEYDTTDYFNEKESSYYENKDRYDDKSKDEYSNDNYDNRQLNTYKDEEKKNENLVYNNEKYENNYVSNNKNNDYKFPDNKNEGDYSTSYHHNNYNIKIKNNFIQDVLECLFQPSIIYVVWQESIPADEADDIFFSFSTNGGLSFSKPYNVSDNPGTSTEPLMEINGNSVYIVWKDSTQTEVNNDLFFSFSSDRGLTFSQPDKISDSRILVDFHAIAASGDNVYVVWEDLGPDGFVVYVTSSTDRGLTFTQPQILSEGLEADSRFPQVAANGDSAYVVWFTDSPREVYFSFSTTKGLSFSQPDRIDDDDSRGTAPQITADGDNVYVVWFGEVGIDEFDIFFTFSTDGGLSFSEPKNISDNLGISQNPKIAVDGDNVYIVWEDLFQNEENAYDIFSSFSNDGGLSFSEPQNISDNAGLSQAAQIAINGNNVYIVWQDDTLGADFVFDIFFSFSNDGGVSFSQPENISDTPESSFAPQLAASGNSVYVVWTEIIPGNTDIMFSFSTDRGLTFSQPDNISLTGASSGNSQIKLG